MRTKPLLTILLFLQRSQHTRHLAGRNLTSRPTGRIDPVAAHLNFGAINCMRDVRLRWSVLLLPAEDANHYYIIGQRLLPRLVPGAILKKMPYLANYCVDARGGRLEERKIALILYTGHTADERVRFAAQLACPQYCWHLRCPACAIEMDFCAQMISRGIIADGEDS